MKIIFVNSKMFPCNSHMVIRFFIILLIIFFFQMSPESMPKIAKIQLVSSHPEVYEPCDDSFLLVDALLADRSNIINQNPKFCLEIGCGSGYVITSLALILSQYCPWTQFYATDINLHATHTTLQTSANHGVHVEVVATDIASSLQKRLQKSIDVLVINPPYVPTPEDEVGADGIVASWAGGFKGRLVIDRILNVVDELLSVNGLIYMVALSENDPYDICQVMKEKGFGSKIALQRSTEEERLCVIKFWREKETSEDGERADNASSLNGWLGKVPFVNSLRKKGTENDSR
ncbi:HemK methyltransferase family member 2 [Rhynchospora pubera]|uniref:HemK methyltransferase family member 2 n=1 Tax=Rhynchospora pubera TaxID=906938 RepID=A0AAV8DX25_9POAL|nr:HemK methyltransferase family member 2 [Rhynchospora pubera]